MKMQNNFKIALYKFENDNFIKVGYKEFIINYTFSPNGPDKLVLVVNGYRTKQSVNLLDATFPFKDCILRAINEYVFAKENELQKCSDKKLLNVTKLTFLYSKYIVNIIRNHLLSINKEDSRDKLTDFNLINLND